MRLFMAIDFDDSVKKVLCDMQAQLKEYVCYGNFTKEQNLHMTLVFLGEIAGSQVSILEQIMDEVKAVPFELGIQGIGSFKRGGSEIWWAGVALNRELASIHEQLSEKLAEEGFKVEKKKFKPHITLIREAVLQGGCDTVKFAQQNETIARVSSLCLMKSEHVHGNLVYTKIYESML